MYTEQQLTSLPKKMQLVRETKTAIAANFILQKKTRKSAKKRTDDLLK